VTARIRAAALGDSITAGTPAWDPDPATRAAIAAPDPESQWMFWAERNDPGVAFANHGVNRERTDQIAERLDAALEGAQAIVLQGGINDIVQKRPLELVVGDIDEMIRRAKDRVPLVFYANVLPWNNGDDDAAARILQLNLRIAELASLHGVRLLDFYSTLESHDEPRRMATEWTVEGNHPSVQGHRRLGELAWPPGVLGRAETSSLLDGNAAS
jgi:lysophospholipase L1-like esterase